jgi:hypothetical protein
MQVAKTLSLSLYCACKRVKWPEFSHILNIPQLWLHARSQQILYEGLKSFELQFTAREPNTNYFTATNIFVLFLLPW